MQSKDAIDGAQSGLISLECATVLQTADLQVIK
jgi:hypothetical protein